jgi:hypothetical protein
MSNLLQTMKRNKELKEIKEIVNYFKTQYMALYELMPGIVEKVVNGSIKGEDFLKIVQYDYSVRWFLTNMSEERINSKSLVWFTQYYDEFQEYIDSVNNFLEKYQDVLKPPKKQTKPILRYKREDWFK